MRIAAVQHNIVWEDPPANFAALAPKIAEAAGAGARLVALTEMFATGFSMDSERIAEEPDGPSTQFLVEQASEHGIWVGGSIALRTPEKPLPTNTLVLAAPDGATHRYAKIHPFTFAGEDTKYSAGEQHVTVDIEGVRVSLFVCYDLRFADEFWPLAPHTDCYLVVANWPESRRDHWRVLLRARAIENQAYVVGVNRVGRGGKLDYVGDSRIIGPLGSVRAEAPPENGTAKEAILIEDVDAARVAEVRAEFPFLRDRRS